MLKFQILAISIVLVYSNNLKIRGSFKCDYKSKFCRHVQLYEEDIFFDDEIANFDEKCVQSQNRSLFTYDKQIDSDYSPNYEFYMIIHHTCTKSGVYKTIRHNFKDTPSDSLVFLAFDINLSADEQDQYSTFGVQNISNSSIELSEKLICSRDEFCRRAYLMRRNEENQTEQLYKYSDFCAMNRTEHQISRKLETVSVTENNDDDENAQFFIEIHHTCNEKNEWKVARKDIEKLSCASTFEMNLDEVGNQQQPRQQTTTSKGNVIKQKQ